jgi:hypothetical protein
MKILLIRDEHHEIRSHVVDGDHLAEVQGMLPKGWTVEIKELATPASLRKWFVQYPQLGARL